MKKSMLTLSIVVSIMLSAGCAISDKTVDEQTNRSGTLKTTLSDKEGNKAYIPKLDFSKTDVYQNSQTNDVYNAQELQRAIETAKSYTTILLHSGDYSDFHKMFPKGLHHITIKSVGENIVIKPLGDNDDAAFTFPNVAKINEQVHNINFIGFTVRGDSSKKRQFVKSVGGKWVDSYGVVHDKGAENPKYGAYNIYFNDITLEGLFMGIFSGLYAHDWTVDNATMKKSTFSHFWYMMGWHLSVINSTLEDAAHDALAIRGHYPAGEVHTYIGVDTQECYGNIYVNERMNRDVSNGFLAKYEWTHLIKNNTFKRISTIRNENNAYIAVAYGIYKEDVVCGAEKTYIPPQNIEISNNRFVNTGEEAKAKNSAILLNAWSGINNDSLASVNGIRIFDNKFTKAKSGETFITGFGIDDLKADEVFNNN